MVQLSVLVNDKPIKEYPHKGNHFVEARKGTNFKLKIYNPTYNTVKVVVSVDGLSVIDGKEAGVDSDAYIIKPLEELIVDGWRTSASTISEFVFMDKENSLSSKSGKGTTNTGVVGVMAFKEAPKPVLRTSYTTAKLNMMRSPILGSGLDSDTLDGAHGSFFYDSAPTAASGYVPVTSALPSNMGTGWGNEVTSFAVKDETTKFESDPYAFAILYYDDKKGLERRGIVVDDRKEFPNPFPKYSVDNSYVKIPRKS